ncbi:hypothetical protein ACLB2K_003250 [Fragaria x ananassa]
MELSSWEGHKAGYWCVMSLLRNCFEMGVKYVTFYAFSIDNFKRPPDEVQLLMNLLQDKIKEMREKKSYVNQFGIRVCFIGNLKLLSEPVRVAAEKAMKATVNNSKAVLIICLAYTSTDEIVHTVEESCKEKMNEVQAPNGRKVSNGVIHRVKEGGKVNVVTETYAHISCNNNFDGEAALGTSAASNGNSKRVEKVKRENGTVNHAVASNGFVEESGKQQQKIPQLKLVDIEKHMYMAVAPDPDIMIRSSGETRLSNFLLWQTSNCTLYSPAALWPEMGLWQLVWAVLNFQRDHYYMEKKKKQASTLFLLHQFFMGSPVQVYQFVKGCVGFSRLDSLDHTTMDEQSFVAAANKTFGRLTTFLRKCLFSVLSVGPIPAHIAFIMDGNRRYAKRRNLPVGEGHKAGYWALMSLLRYCWEMGVKYVTVYAFSIDNFKRSPEEVQTLMDLLQEKIEGLLDKESYLNQAGVRVRFIGNLKILSEPVRAAAENAMKATVNNSKAVLSICVAYTSD